MVREDTNQGFRFSSLRGTEQSHTHGLTYVPGLLRASK